MAYRYNFISRNGKWVYILRTMKFAQLFTMCVYCIRKSGLWWGSGRRDENHCDLTKDYWRSSISEIAPVFTLIIFAILKQKSVQLDKPFFDNLLIRISFFFIYII